MTANEATQTEARDVAHEASRYLNAVEVLASLSTDPHAAPRAHATHTYRGEDHVIDQNNDKHERR